MWSNKIAGCNGQAEKDGATFVSRDTSKKSQEHREFSNLMTLKTEFLGNLTHIFSDNYFMGFLAQPNSYLPFLNVACADRVKTNSKVTFKFLGSKAGRAEHS